MQPHFIILGGGQAGATAAALLRQKGYAGRLTLICNETQLPYERPPLSKAALLDKKPSLQPILPDNWWQDHQVEVIREANVTQLECARRTIHINGHDHLHFDKLLIATGARARGFPLLDALGDRAFTLRHQGDATRLRPHLEDRQHLIIVGAGTIGLEVAASARQLGCDVTIIEVSPVLMGRNTPKPVQDYLLNYHRDRGITFHFDAQIELAQADNKGVTLTLQDGQQVKGDRIVYGIGIEPNDELAQRAGLDTRHGIVVDSQCRTSHPSIFAAGDVTISCNKNGEFKRKETWENANRQADIATSAMLDLPVTQMGADWFWTDQYNINLQFIGDIHSDHWQVRGNIDTHKAIWLNVVDGILRGAITLNQGREIRLLRKLIDNASTVDAAKLADESVPLKTLLK